MKLIIPNTQPNYHPWWLNSLLLSEETFVSFISSQIEMLNQIPGMSPTTVWESMQAYL
jgi:hypothetical protein